MVSVYLVGISVIVASAIGIPLGILGGLSDRFWRVLEAVSTRSRPCRASST